MWCICFPGDKHFSVFQRSLVYKAFLSKLARCSKQPNYWVKPRLSLPTAQHPASVSDPRELLLSSLPMSFTPLALPGLRLPSHCYRTSAPEPLLVKNPGHGQKLLLCKWKQWIWHSMTSHYSSSCFCVDVCRDWSFFKQRKALGKCQRGGGKKENA